ncbi:MAG: hypothetical protein QOD77_406 [Thermoplasmata archaeon]|nr:hypothetical protein [Thermoplasmata archaeon]
MDAPLRHRRAGFVAVLALLAQVTALFLPWWVLTFSDAESEQPLGAVSLWTPGDLAAALAVRFTLVMAVLGLPILVVRIAATSWQHEWAKWRRDLLAVASTQVVALASCLFWPLEFPFWGLQERLSATTGTTYFVEGMPGFGWWLMATALVLVAVAWWMSRPVAAQQGEGGEP